MKIGFHNNPRKNMVEEIDWIGKNGFDFVDIFLEDDQADPSKVDVEKVKKVIKKHNLETVGHTAWYLPIGSPTKELRDVAVTKGLSYFELLSKFDVKYATIHANWPPNLFKEKEGIKFQIDSLKRLVKEGKKFGVKVMYEPITHSKDNLKNVGEILKNVSGLFFHLDTGHAFLHGKRIEDFIKKFHKKLVHVHLHDNDGKDDLHLPMGTGVIDWTNVIKILKQYYDGTITLEVFSQDKDYVIMTKNKLRELWNKS